MKTGTESQWLEFKARQDDPTTLPCPFCGIRHTPGKTVPFCDMVVRFKFSIGVN